jgi:hypothetical protein
MPQENASNAVTLCACGRQGREKGKAAGRRVSTPIAAPQLPSALRAVCRPLMLLHKLTEEGGRRQGEEAC